MTGTEYENWCAGRLKKLGFRNIRMTKATGDQGIDILAEKHGKLYGIQCKYYSGSVGNDAVQEAYAGGSYYGCDVAAVVTSSSFTSGARALAQETDVLLVEHFSPQHTFDYFRFVQGVSAMLFPAALYLIALGAAEESDVMILHGTFAACGAVLSLLSRGRYAPAAAGGIFCLIFCASALKNIAVSSLYALTAVLSAVLAVLQSMRFTIMTKRRAFAAMQTEKKEIREMMREDVRQIGMRYADLMAEDFGCRLILKEAERKREGTLCFTYRSERNTGRLLEKEETVLREEGENVSLEALSERMFRMTLKQND